jgi:hypothetical protein
MVVTKLQHLLQSGYYHQGKFFHGNTLVCIVLPRGWTLSEIACKVEASNKTPAIDGCVQCDECCGIRLNFI